MTAVPVTREIKIRHIHDYHGLMPPTEERNYDPDTIHNADHAFNQEVLDHDPTVFLVIPGNRMKSFTIEEALNELEKNGLPKITHNLFDYDGNFLTGSDTALVGEKVVGVCALGQICVNIGVKDIDDWTTQDEFNSWVMTHFIDVVADLNDSNPSMPFAEIAKKIRETDFYKNYKYFVIDAGEFEYTV